MRMLSKAAVVVFLATTGAWITFETLASGQASSRAMTVAPQAGGALRQWDRTVDQMARDGELRLRRTQDDPVVEGRTHERFDQYHQGVRVFGSDLSRQIDNGQTVSMFGVIYADVNIDTTPRLTVDGAKAAIERAAHASLSPRRTPELVILPRESGALVLTYTAELWTDEGPTVYFVDAKTGAEVWHYLNLQTQAAVRAGKGVLGDDKKVSMRESSGTYVADDQLRPPAVLTFDMKGNLTRTKQFLNGQVSLTMADVASSSADPWTDGASVDAQVYQGWTYDFYFKRFGRRGLDNNDIRLIGLVHTVRQSDALFATSADLGTFFVNAFYAGEGVMVYGEGLPSNVTLGGQRWNFVAGSLDAVSHELTHGVTDFTSGLIYLNESGALNEAFSDMMGISCEFFYASIRQRPGNYLIGDDVVTPGGIRSMSDPLAFGHPDNYARRNVGAQDNGFVHSNSGIANNAFYLAIEGGTNRTSGLAVQGVGGANREQIEKVFYRAFVFMLPRNATFSIARAATIQAARDLYGAGGTVERAVTQAWTAVGVS